MAILITGVAGFIGHALAARLLARGESVIGIDNLNDYYDPALKRARLSDLEGRFGTGFAFHKADFSDHVALEAALSRDSISTIAHLGAQAGVRYSLENPRAYVQANLVGHLNLLEMARTHRVPMVYASSSSVYGGNTSLPFRVEDRVDHPVSLYAATKRADELMSETYAHLYRIPLTGLRFFTVYGPWGRPDMAMWIFTRDILAGKPIPVFNHGRMKRDFTYIDDIVSGIVAAMDNPVADDGAVKAGASTAPHRLYNIGNNRSEELMDLIGAIEAACGKKAMLDLRPMQPGDVLASHADIEAIGQDLGYDPKTPISAGVPRFVDWFKAYHGITA